jgi:hypothetical protein
MVEISKNENAKNTKWGIMTNNEGKWYTKNIVTRKEIVRERISS